VGGSGHAAAVPILRASRGLEECDGGGAPSLAAACKGAPRQEEGLYPRTMSEDLEKRQEGKISRMAICKAHAMLTFNTTYRV